MVAEAANNLKIEVPRLNFLRLFRASPCEKRQGSCKPTFKTRMRPTLSMSDDTFLAEDSPRPTGADAGFFGLPGHDARGRSKPPEEQNAFCAEEENHWGPCYQSKCKAPFNGARTTGLYGQAGQRLHGSPSKRRL